MAHPQQKAFCERVRHALSEWFVNSKVVDFGSLDINGSNGYLFKECDYTGVDLDIGRNVDEVMPTHEYKPDAPVDVVISTEMLEHDEHWELSLKNMVDILRPGGLLLFTCATTGRPEHGTKKSSPDDSPFTPEYYRNLTKEDVMSVLDVDALFSDYVFEVDGSSCDLYFWGLKRGLVLSDTRQAEAA